MSGVWLVLAKAEVLFFAIGAVVVLIAGIVNIAIEYRERKQNAAEPEDEKDILETAITEQTGGRDRDGVQRVEALRGGDGDSGIGAGARAAAERIRRIA